MFKIIVPIVLLISLFTIEAREISLQVKATPGKFNTELSEDQELMLNGFQQTVTLILGEQKLDSGLYWSKLEKKKMTRKEEFLFLKNLFTNETISRPASEDAKITSLTGSFQANVDTEKLKQNYEEVVFDLGETRAKTFYLLATLELDRSLSWSDLGISGEEGFNSVILESWKKHFEKNLKGFEKIVVLEKDFPVRPDYMNPKSVTLKWKSRLKKVSDESYELNAQYVLQKTKSQDVVTALDFPEQNRKLKSDNKKVISSALASMTYNLLYSQTTKLQSVLDADASALAASEVELKIMAGPGLTDAYQIISVLEETFKPIKLTAQLKSYAIDGSTIKIRAEGSADNILDNLAIGGGKFPFNEQKVLHFNRADKTFAILPKESNN
ncbi:MAG: hypothetical protein WC635_09910 [Bacteriovorax sp.]|jgi:hypothetical protein